MQKKREELKEVILKNKEYKEKLSQNPYKLKINKEKNIKFLLIILILCIFTGFLTPIGDTPYTYLVKTMQGNTTQNINEHSPLVLINSKEMLTVLILFFIFLMFTDIKIRLKDVFLLGGLIFLSLLSKRQLSLFYLIGIIPFNIILCSFLDKYDNKASETIKKLMVTMIGRIICLIIIVLASYLLYKKQLNRDFVNKSTYPYDAAEFIKNNMDLDTMRLFNEYNYGSYLLLQEIPVFIDSRADLYAPEFNGGQDIFTDFLDISRLDKYYEDNFEKYDITHVIIYKRAKLNMFLRRDSGYIELYADDNFVIYERLRGNDGRE